MQNGDIFWGLLKFLIFMGVFEVPDIFWVVKVDAGARAYVCRKN